jgi:hypothetical protein
MFGTTEVVPCYKTGFFRSLRSRALSKPAFFRSI